MIRILHTADWHIDAPLRSFTDHQRRELRASLLELPGMINDLPRRLPELTVGNDYRLHILDHALESGRILTRPAHEDLQKIQLAVEKKKIAYEQAVRFSTLDYAGRMQRAGINSASIMVLAVFI